MVDKMTVIKDDDENKCNVNKITNVNVDNIIDDEEQSFITDKDLPLSFNKGRHLDIIGGINCITQTWRMKERMKTVSVALVLCLNVGVDPPDIYKTQPCAKLECWIDPLLMSATKALEAIGLNLQKQYERWQPRARYKQSLDPTAEEVKKLCTSLRRNAKEERVLFHYNGHGVPKPTQNGEIWVFNRAYTQYIPLSIYDLQTWMGAPSIYVYDCSNAGIIVESFKQFAVQHQNEYEANTQGGRGSSPSPPCYKNCIQLAACGPMQVLPMNPDLPADLFTSCLTTPIKVALKWYVLQSTSKLVPEITMDLIDKIPGQISDRRTMLGELNWIFTAITDTIAWNTLPKELFQKLFRQDLLVASLFRNFLLAERIMRSCDCTPISSPSLPPTYQHAMWQAWDLALDLSLGQLPRILKYNEPFVHLPFFEEQLTAFQVWLELGSERRNPPEQLPIVLQVLLSQVHRMKALELLGKFLDLGPWAVNLALSVGIFPYVLKLLQSCAKELRPLLVFIWAKILAVDNTCQSDLVRDNGHKYFLSVLQDTTISAECRTQAAFVLACIVNGYLEGKKAALQGSLVSICLEQLSDPCPHLRQWVAICLGKLWDNYDKARWTGVRDIAHEKLYILLQDSSPEVRAAAVYALGTFINSVCDRSEHAKNIDHSVAMTLMNNVSGDMSSLVRKELVAALQWMVLAFENAFVSVALKEQAQSQDNVNTQPGMKRISSTMRIMSPSLSHNAGMDHLDTAERLKRVASSSSISTIGHSIGIHHQLTGSLGTLPGHSYGSVYMKLWSGLCVLDTDPHPEVAKMCNVITKYIRNQVKEIHQYKDADGRLSSSMSLPPSPNRTYYLHESPPTLHPNELHRYAARSSIANRNRKMYPSPISEDSDDKEQRKSLVSTQFVEWSCKQFATPIMKPAALSDVESLTHYEREWRYLRNERVRKQFRGDYVKRKLNVPRIEAQLFNTKCSTPPTILQFHPYDQQIAAVGRDTFGIWDWNTGARIAHCQCKSLKNPNSRITSLEWINSFDIAMVLVGLDDGSVKLYKPKINREPSLVSAWQAHSELLHSNNKTTPSGINSSLLLCWEQWTQTVITAGDVRVLRFWDAEKELRVFDIPTGTDSPVTCIDSTYASVSHEHQLKSLPKEIIDDDDEGLCMGSDGGGSIDEMTTSFDGQRLGLVVAGCSDGSVRLYDRRCNPNEARVRTWIEYNSSILNVQMYDNKILSGSTLGDVRIHDIRSYDSIPINITYGQSMTSFAAHRSAEIFACGTQQSVSIYNWSGYLINTIRFYEGFMGSRLGPVSCLTYHPYKTAMAMSSDSSIIIYGESSSRR